METASLPGRRRGFAALWLGLAAAAAVCLALWGYGTALSSDDYWYALFMDGSVGDYFTRMAGHYATFNGRMVVHFFAQLILKAGTWLFGIFMAGLCVGIPLAAGRCGGLRGERLALCVLVFLLGVLTLPRPVAVQGLLWISAFCNYVLPTGMILGEVWLFQRLERSRRWLAWGAGCCVWAFLCGATTEQSGVAAALMAALALGDAALRRRKQALGYALALLCAVGGWATILSSPATQMRVERETVSDTAEGLWASLEQGAQTQGELLGSQPWVVGVLLGLMAVSAFLLLRKKWRSVFVVLAIAAGSAAAVGLAVSGELWAYWTMLGALLALAGLYALAGRRVPAALLAAAVAVAAVLLPTRSSAERTLLPFLLYLLCVLAMGLGELLAGRWRRWLVLGLCVGAVAYAAGEAPGYWHNFQVERTNRQQIREFRETGVLWIWMDYDREFTHTKMYEDASFLAHYLEGAGADGEEARICFYSEEMPPVYVDGVRARFPALPGESGQWLAQLQAVVDGMGGTVEAGSQVAFTVDGKDYLIEYPWSGSPTTMVLHIDQTGWHYLEVEKSRGYCTLSLGREVYTQWLGAQVALREFDWGTALWVTTPGAYTGAEVVEP